MGSLSVDKKGVVWEDNIVLHKWSAVSPFSGIGLLLHFFQFIIQQLS